MDDFEQQLKWFIEHALMEDVGDGDHTTLACIPEDDISTARLLIKDVGVIAGIDVARQIFLYLDKDAEFEALLEDGEDVDYGDVAFRVTCRSHALLKAERVVLNVMQRMSGIATMSSRFAVEVEGLPVTILDTRKTTPLLRFLEKFAVKIGGCENYRSGLYDRIMIKDNHIKACGSIKKAILKVADYLEEHSLDLEITIEVRNLVELYEVMEVGKVDRIMFDNFEIPLLVEAVQVVDGRYETEASGGVTLESVRKFAETGVNYVSSGALTHSAGSIDLSLKIIK